MNKNKVQIMSIAALLCAVGIVIPMVAPKIVIPPASYTLASHVPVFIAMFMSPIVAIGVALITGFGFLSAGYPLVIVFRALTHVIFAGIGAYVLKHHKSMLHNSMSSLLFAFIISLIHAICEVLVVTFFYWGNNVSTIYYERGYLFAVVGLVGVGTLIHSMIDFGIAIMVWKPIQGIITVPVSVRLKTKKS